MTTCSESAAAEAMAGSSPFRRVWLVIEQPGAWGADALTESDLPAGFGQALKETLTDSEIGVVLARRPSSHSVERRATNRRRIWLAHCAPAGVRMRAGSLDNVTDLLRWDWAAIKKGELPPVGRRSADPALFLCVNGKRDACCAIHGRKVIDELRNDPELTGQVFEASHLGGHRFTPTALMLPWGYLYGRLTAAAAREALSLAWQGRTLTSSLRGRSSLPAWAQVAELAVREKADTHPVDALDVLIRRGERWLPSVMSANPESADEVQVRHTDGRAWDVALESFEVAPRSLSCGEPLTSGQSWRAASISAEQRWR